MNAAGGVDEAEVEVEDAVGGVAAVHPSPAQATTRPHPGRLQTTPRARTPRGRGSLTGQHAALRERMGAFTDALLGATPAIPGLDSTVVVPPRRLHFTLGVMSLDTQPESEQRTLEKARAVLQVLRPRVLEALGGRRLSVRLDRMDVMRPERGDAERAHVMWVGPAQEGGSGRRLKRVAEMIAGAFKDAGLLIDEGRPLKLHCTVVNTVYRRPRGRERTPFSYTSVLASEVMKDVRAVDTRTEGERRGPVHVDFGEWEVDELQVCAMGSSGPEGEYVAAACCLLHD
ncbi:AKAP7 2'5' RNA ligase-like domain-containing protein [Lenzites betulinus]|nr:AKAP7 2'5' RNA ligase-like domain-containing protein [Lenzites betulinus]